MVYIVLAAVAVFCFFFCFYILAKVENEPERHKPAWQDADADEEKQTITYRSSRRIREVEDKSTPWRHDPEEEKVAYYEDDVCGMGSFKRWLLGYGASVMVLEPYELAEDIYRILQRRLERYE